MGGQQAGRLIAILHAQPVAGMVQVGVDGVLGNAELTADLLGTQVVMDQPQALALAGRQQLDGLPGRLSWLVHV